ncbi:hypothetical protein [Kordiimonas aestuarii]|uniref:hypothetical protein n=1 Tax=Kordiimonas aestuarii TaxID=1005925 RepID=UPI0021CE12E7|nr:hypothetical protein [Kordiimonas aestuarii]
MHRNYPENKAFTVKIGLKYVSIFISLSVLGACSHKDDNWPNLSDPLPDTEARNKTETASITPSVKPPAPPRPVLSGEAAALPDAQDPVPQTADEASILLEDIKKALREETLAYRQAVAKLGTVADGDVQDAWFSAQLALTRLSRTASRLDPLTELEMPRVKSEALTEADIIERFVVGERQRLADSEPQ